jgi:hypothetical protein
MVPKARIPRPLRESELRAAAVVVVRVLLLSSIPAPLAAAEVALRAVAEAELFPAATLPAVSRCPMCLVPLDQ